MVSAATALSVLVTEGTCAVMEMWCVRLIIWLGIVNISHHMILSLMGKGLETIFTNNDDHSYHMHLFFFILPNLRAFAGKPHYHKVLPLIFQVVTDYGVLHQTQIKWLLLFFLFFQFFTLSKNAFCRLSWKNWPFLNFCITYIMKFLNTYYDNIFLQAFI